MKHPLRWFALRWFDAHWRTRICFVLAGTIFVLSQFLAAGPPPTRENVTVRGTGSILAETQGGEARASLD
jgi:hypothetical protein